MAKDGSSNLITCEAFEPFCKWKKQDDSDILEVHVPDFKKEQLRVRISNNSLLIISGEREMAEDAKKIQFLREIKLSKGIYYTDQIRAKFGDGVLSIIMPKKKATESSNSHSQEVVGKPKLSEASVVSDSLQAAAAQTPSKNFISVLRNSISTFEFDYKTVVALVSSVGIVALGLGMGAYYFAQK